MPEAFLPFQPQEISLQDLYGEEKPVYDFIALSKIATDSQLKHYCQFSLIIQQLRAWAEKNFTAEEAKSFSAALKKFHERYAKGNIGDLTQQEYGKFKAGLESLCLLFQKGPKPLNEKKALFRNFIQQLSVCPDGNYTSIPHLKAMLEDNDCYEAWLARKRYDILEKAKNSFMDLVYDPENFLGGMDIHVLNAFIMRAAALGYAPSVDMKDIKRDKYVPRILAEYQDFIDDFIKQHFEREYTLDVILETVEKNFIKSVASTRADYLKKAGLNAELKADHPAPLAWEKWQPLKHLLKAKFEPLSSGDEDFCAETMLTALKEEETFKISLKFTPGEDEQEPVKLGLTIEDEDADRVKLLPMDAFQAKIKPQLRRCLYHRLSGALPIPLADKNELYLNNTPENSFILTPDNRTIPYLQYVFNEKDRETQAEVVDIFRIGAEKARLSGEIESRMKELQEQRRPLRPTPLRPLLAAALHIVNPAVLMRLARNQPQIAMLALVFLPVAIITLHAVSFVNCVKSLINMGKEIRHSFQLKSFRRQQQQKQEQIQSLTQEMETRAQKTREAAAERQKAAAAIKAEAALPAVTLEAKSEVAIQPKTSGELPGILVTPEEPRTPVAGLAQNSIFAEKAKLAAPQAFPPAGAGRVQPPPVVPEGIRITPASA